MRLGFHPSRQPAAARGRQLLQSAQPSSFSGHDAVTLARAAVLAKAFRAQFSRVLLLDLFPRSDMGRAMREGHAHVVGLHSSCVRIERRPRPPHLVP